MYILFAALFDQNGSERLNAFDAADKAQSFVGLAFDADPGTFYPESRGDISAICGVNFPILGSCITTTESTLTTR